MKELLYQLWLISRQGISTVKSHRLRQALGSFTDVFEADLPAYAEVLGPHPDPSLLDKGLDGANEMLERCESLGIRVVSFYGGEYPARLRELDEAAPMQLFVRGSLSAAENSLCIAVVGARRSSLYGNSCATKIAHDLARTGAVIVSGMARGIDTAAHRGALSADADTIAVLGCGTDVCYPPENGELKRIIESHGAVISELPPGTRPLGAHFPARNRIISGLSAATVMVEGRATSGSTITARLAMEQGREVFCVPGGIDRDLSVGPHQLIRDGARLVTSAQDIIIDLSRDYPEHMVDVLLGDEARERIEQAGMEKLPPDQRLVAGALRRDFPTHIDEICHKTAMDAGVVTQCLLMLEINGIAVSLPGKQYMLKG